MSKARVLLADDHTLLLEGLTKLFQPEFEVVGVVTDGLELMEKAEALKPDILLIDISMPGLNGLDAARRISADLPQTKVVFLTTHDNEGLCS